MFKRHLAIICFIVFTSLNSFSQKNDTIRLYYDIDQKEVTPQISLLDSLSTILMESAYNKIKVNIIGYADFLGSTEYNLRLSKTRADNVKYYLEKNSPEIKFESFGKGEMPSLLESSSGDPRSRRVDLIIIEHIRQPSAKNEEISTNIISIPLQPKDTIISTPIIDLTGDKPIANLANSKPGDRITIEELTFQPGRHFLRPEALPYIHQLRKIMRRNRQLTIEIQGHVCCTDLDKDGYDFDEANNTLSLNRAKFIYEYLVKNGIDSERMRYKGFGASRPKVYPELTTKDEIRNRRVVIEVIKNR